MKFINNLKQVNYIQINNKYLINNKLKDDYILNIYYINEKKVYIIIRKINNMNGWNNDISIKIFNINNTYFENIYIGSSIKNYKKINIYSNKIIFKKRIPENIKIPRIIFQTNKSHSFENDLSYNSILSFIEFNPNYEYKFFDDIESREFIKNNFDEKYLFYYDKLYPGAFKADFFRYCYLYINGGFYFDNKSILLVSLDSIIDKNDELILCQDNHKLGLYNAIMMSVPKHKIFMNLLNKIIYKIENFNSIYMPFKNKNYSKLDNILSLTGPNLLYEEFNLLKLDYHKHIYMKHDILGNYQNYKNLIVTFKKNLILYKNYNNFNIHNPNHYSKLWNKHFLFNKNININNKVFLIKPTNNIQFIDNLNINFYFIDNKLLIVTNKQIIQLEISIIEENSELKNIILPSINDYYLIDYNYIQNIDYIIQSISIKNEELNKENYEKEIEKLNKLKIEVNKINNNYYLIIINNQLEFKNNIQIKTNVKIFEVNIHLFHYENYKIYKLNNIHTEKKNEITENKIN